jgi:hypothetical protein
MAVSEYLAREEDRCHPTSAAAPIVAEINAAMRKVDDDCHPTGAALGLAIVAFITALAFTPIGFWAGWHYGWQAGFAADLAENQR